jgi:hypothetical protein
MELSGGRLCSKIRYNIRAVPIYAGYCHCKDCQRANAAGRITAAGFNRLDVDVIGDLKAYWRQWQGGSAILRSLVRQHDLSDAGPVSLCAEPSIIPRKYYLNLRCFCHDRPGWETRFRLHANCIRYLQTRCDRF